MLGDVDAFDFILAEHLKQPLSAVRAWPAAEVEEWRGYILAKPALAVMAGQG